MNILYCAIDLFGLGDIQRYSRYEVSCLDQPFPEALTTTPSRSRVEYFRALIGQGRCSTSKL